MRARVIAIDGPSGSGKSTTARAVAKALSLASLDTGAMYRAATLAALEARVDLADPQGTAEVVARSEIVVDGEVTRLDGVDVSHAIREPAVNRAVSQVAAHAPVRELLARAQRAWIESHDGGVVEGRDIGTVVFPTARVKIYLVARADERARRRYEEVPAERRATVAGVGDSLRTRDEIDSSRAAGPLRPADDAITIDTSDRDLDDVVAEIVAHYRSGDSE